LCTREVAVKTKEVELKRREGEAARAEKVRDVLGLTCKGGGQGGKVMGRDDACGVASPPRDCVDTLAALPS
jgi:hypothetical protein